MEQLTHPTNRENGGDSTAPLASLASTQQVADRLGVSRSQVYALIRQGEFQVCKIGKCTRIRLEEVDQFIQKLFGPTQGGR
jgi:excisionase family DNA binding protein